MTMEHGACQQHLQINPKLWCTISIFLYVYIYIFMYIAINVLNLYIDINSDKYYCKLSTCPSTNYEFQNVSSDFPKNISKL